MEGCTVRLDDRGRVPFALLGVFLLLSSMFSITYISDIQSRHLEQGIREDVIQESLEISALVHHEVETEAYIAGATAVRLSAGNLSRIALLYEGTMESYFEQEFPRLIEDFRIEVRGTNTSLVIRTGTLEDYGKEVVTESDTFQNEAFEELETSHSGQWMELDRAMTFSVTGAVDYAVIAKGIVAKHTHEFTDDVDSLVPFLKGKLSTLASDSASDLGDISRITKYMLSSLAQMRVLQGWGSMDEDAPSTSMILKRDDVETIINMALVLKSIALFRAFDEDAVRAFDSLNPSSDGGATLTDLTTHWRHSSQMDPSDLLILLKGREESAVSVGPIVSQAIYAMIDQMTLKYFGYFGLAPVVDLSLQAAQMLANSIQDFLFWISGEDKEAWLARSWFRDLAQDTGIVTVISHPFVFKVPDSEFQISAENGTVVNVTVPAFSSFIPFEERDLAHGFDDFWRSCYQLIYEVDVRIVHENQRDLVADLAARIGEVAENAGGPVVISESVDPTDNVSSLEVAGSVAKETASRVVSEMRTNESLIREIIEKLWQSQAGMVDGVFSRIEDEIDTLIGDQAKVQASTTIVEDLLLEIQSQPEYVNLTAEEKERVHEAVVETVVARDLGGKAVAMMLNRTIAELRAAGQRAASLNASSQEGGVYSRLRDYVIESSGVLGDALRSVWGLIDSIVEMEDSENIPFFLSKTEEAFRFRIRGEDSFEDRSREFEVNVSQTPKYLRSRGWPEECDGQELDFGTLCIVVRGPLEAHSESNENVHYTDITRNSFAPYVASWNVRIKGLFEVSATTHRLNERLVGCDDGITGRIPLDFEIRLSVRSGWGLEGIEYESSDTFLEGIWETLCRFIDSIWEGLLKVFDWILDGIMWLVSLVKDLCNTLLSYAKDVMRGIYDVVEKTIELLRSAISGIAGLVGGLIENIISSFGATELHMSVLGGYLSIGLNQGNGTIFRGEFVMGGLSVGVAFKKLSEMNLTRNQRGRTEYDYDVLLRVEATFGNLDLDGKFDPAMVLEDSFFNTTVRWGDDWAIELKIPHVERYQERRYNLEIPPIPIPVGTLDVELGILIRSTGEVGNFDFIGIFSKSFEHAWNATLRRELSIESVSRFVDVGFSTAIGSVIEAVEGNLCNVSEMVLYFEGQVRAGASAGVGVRLVVAVKRDVLLEGFSWLAAKLRRLLGMFGSPPSVGIERSLEFEIASGVFLGLEILFSLAMPRLAKIISGDQELGVEVLLVVSVYVNLAALGRLLGMSPGRWRVDFGICLEGLPPSVLVGDHRDGETVNLWLLRGSAHQM